MYASILNFAMVADQTSSNNTFRIILYTVERVYKGHCKGPESVTFMSSYHMYAVQNNIQYS